MGIPRYANYVKNKNYKNAWRYSIPSNVSTLSLDANGILHASAQLNYAYGEKKNPRRKKQLERLPPHIAEKQYHATVSSKILEIVNIVNPTQALLICVDGVAPTSKIRQQRQRRYRAAMERMSSGSSSFDSNAITPGTDFMDRLDRYLIRWLDQNKMSLPPTVIYSGHRVPGEGEHKIMELYRTRDEFKDPRGIHVLYGLDADLIMLSMISPVKNIFLMREDVSDVINIEALRVGISSEMTGVAPVSMHQGEKRKKKTGSTRALHPLRDYIVIMSLMGNDFLPHVFSLSDMPRSIDTMMAVYQELQLPLTEQDPNSSGISVHWNNFATFLEKMIPHEDIFLNELTTVPFQYPPETLLKCVHTKVLKKSQKRITKLDVDEFRVAWYEHIFVPTDTPGLESIYKLTEEPYTVNETNFNELLFDYVTGIAWMLSYYVEGHRSVSNWFQYKPLHAPLLGELAPMVRAVSAEGLVAHRPQSGDVAIRIAHQLLSVLPPASIDLIPEKFRYLLLNDMSPIRDLFPEKFRIDREATNRDYQGIAMVPPPDLVRIVASVATVKIGARDADKLFGVGADIVYERVPQPAVVGPPVRIRYPKKKFDVARPASPTRAPDEAWKKLSFM